MPVQDLSHDEIERLYGPWDTRTPSDAAALFAGYPGRWWIAGGWAIEAFTGVRRAHGDLDPSVPRSELALLRRHLSGRLDLWAADQGSLRPLLPADLDADELPGSCENVWARASGADPWQYDIIVMTATATTWTFKRDGRIRRPLADIVWSREGISYLRPEIQLLHKAHQLRPQDQADFDAAAPLLERRDRDWLRAAVTLAHPGHPWLEVL
ncbi:hypothetical protein SAMN04488543_2176 [Friedmanniella luteola]|uniref:Aminoglycoside-2''-adenylyltransferase n=1 Tax=Friedmanniella luteola TaxID=546871 RepID=A0A1H1U6N9_9ACTN|nr:hypothetical protein [Friedmanniella luteola]SDS67916.1 hypothetical protein SAMN04488543_2176 [Friedmanniella luteola]